MGVGLGWRGNVKGQCHCKKTIKEVPMRIIILTLGRIWKITTYMKYCVK